MHELVANLAAIPANPGSQLGLQQVRVMDSERETISRCFGMYKFN